MESRISMVTLGVNNLDESIKFYEEGLNFSKIYSPPGIAFFNLNGSWLGLFPWESLAEDVTVSPDGNGFRGVTLAHNTKTEDEVKTIMEQAILAGATLVKEPQHVSWGGFSGYFKDLDGHLWEVAYNPFFWVGPESKNA